MPILLTTPYNPGDLDPGVSYTHSELRLFSGDFRANAITFAFQHGYLDAGSFKWGKVEPMVITVIDNPKTGATNYTDMMTELSIDGEIISSGVARVLYTYALTKGIVVGTPVDPNA